MRISRGFVYAIVAIALVAGVYARVTHIDGKLFFQDEAFTALRVSGHSESRYRATFFDGNVRTAGDIAALMTRDPATNPGSVVALLAREDPHHAPLYYVLDRWTIDALGSSIADYRALSVLFGLLTIAAAYFFGTTALDSRLGGAVLAALVAVSPFHVLYSQMAREYSLFTCVASLSCAFALRGIARRTLAEFACYAVTVALGMYVDPLFVLVIAAQGLCAILALRRDRRALTMWVIAVAAAGALFVPWALNALSHHGNVEDQLAWGATAYPIKALAQKWAFNVGAVFFDAEFVKLALAPIALVAIAIAIGSLAVVIARGPKTPGIVLGLALTFVPILAFVVFDALNGSHFSTIPRYLSAGWLGLEIVTASGLRLGLRSVRFGGVALAGFAFLVVAGVSSAFVDARYANWWTNNDQIAFQLVARDVDAAKDPLVISEAHWHVPLVLAWYLKPSVSMLLFRVPNLPRIPTHASVFVVAPSADAAVEMRVRLASRAALENVSPRAYNAITEFHQGLHPQTSTNLPPSYDMPMSPFNALWRIVPKAAVR